MLNETAQGVFTIAVTPFKPDGGIDLDSVDNMTDFYLEKGASGLTVLGMMGEAPKLTNVEALGVVDRVVARVDGKVPVVVGVSAPGLAQMKELSQSVMGVGAAGVMVAPVSSLRSDRQIADYFSHVADTLGDIPFVLQDFPLATSVVMPPKVILKIVDDCPTCVMLKHEDWPGLEKISALRAASDDGARRISILCGNAGLFLPEEMARGADGAMTGFAYPEMMADVIAAYKAGDSARARDLFDAYLPLVRYESQPGLGLAVRKHILAKRGAIAHPTIRKPGPSLSPVALSELDQLMIRQSERLAALA